MNRKKIGILFGGSSSEYEISLKSAYGIISHIDRKRYEPVLLGITREGTWFLYQGDIERIKDGSWYRQPACIPAVISPDRRFQGVVYMQDGVIKQIRLDAALPVMHGRLGEDGTVQGLLELAGIPFIGCGTKASAVCMDKDLSHRLASSVGIRVPKSKVLTIWGDREKALAWAEAIGYPIFVKPATEGSSIGISRVFGEKQLGQAVDIAFRYDTKVILEEEIPGFEVGCAVLGCEDPLLGCVDEIEVSGGFFDFQEKYTQKRSKIHVPARISAEKMKEIQEAAKRIYWVLGCKGFARVDLFLTPEGELVFNEVNTIPGFTPYSRYPNMMKQIGLSYGEVVERLIRTEVLS